MEIINLPLMTPEDFYKWFLRLVEDKEMVKTIQHPNPKSCPESSLVSWGEHLIIERESREVEDGNQH